jgi:threonine dehydratase
VPLDWSADGELRAPELETAGLVRLRTVSHTISTPLLQVVDEWVTCTEAEIAAALRQLAWQENMVVEGAAALALAGFARKADELRGRVNVVVLCGANYDRDRILPAILG